MYSDCPDGASFRTEDERFAAHHLHDLFLDLTGEPKKKALAKALEIKFVAKGGAVIPSTTAEAFITIAHMKLKQDKQGLLQSRRYKRS